MVDASLRATILDELRTLNRELGISIVYITHDLTTAYQICDNIVVLYRGTVAEAGVGGAGDRRRPSTPTRSCWCPRSRCPTSTSAWGGDEIPIPEAAGCAAPTPAASFAPRCPHVMDMCWTAPPPKYRARQPSGSPPASSIATRPVSPERRCRHRLPAASPKPPAAHRRPRP